MPESSVQGRQPPGLTFARKIVLDTRHSGRDAGIQRPRMATFRFTFARKIVLDTRHSGIPAGMTVFFSFQYLYATAIFHDTHIWRRRHRRRVEPEQAAIHGVGSPSPKPKGPRCASSGRRMPRERSPVGRSILNGSIRCKPHPSSTPLGIHWLPATRPHGPASGGRMSMACLSPSRLALSLNVCAGYRRGGL